MRVAYKIFFVLAAVCVAWSCSPTKYVWKDEYLLDRVKSSEEGGGVNAVDVKRNIRQRPNTRILGTVRFHLGLYNLSGRDGEKRFNRWLRRIGEEPVIYDSTLVDRSAEQIRLYLKNAGFYNSVVRDTVVFRRKRATVSYAVETGPRTVIREVVFRQDTSGGRHRRAEVSGLLGNYYRDTTATLLDVDTPLDLGLLDDERERITQMLREKGYFNFSKNFVRFLADTTSDGRERRARLFVRLADELPDSNSYRRYFIRNISVNLDYDALLTARQVDSLYQSFDYEGYRVSYRGKLKIRPKVVIETIQLERMELYNAQQELETYARLQALGLCKLEDVECREGKDEVRTLTSMSREAFFDAGPVPGQPYFLCCPASNRPRQRQERQRRHATPPGARKKSKKKSRVGTAILSLPLSVVFAPSTQRTKPAKKPPYPGGFFDAAPIFFFAAQHTTGLSAIAQRGSAVWLWRLATSARSSRGGWRFRQ